MLCFTRIACSMRLPHMAAAWCRPAALLLAAALLALSPTGARAGEDGPAAPGVLSPGDTVVTGFSGLLPPPSDLPAGADPLDYSFIDPDGASMEVQRPLPAGPPAGQLIDAPTLFSAPARDVGQVFAVTLDDAAAPDIFLGATSAFGIHIVAPGDDGMLHHVRQGMPGAQFMRGQWGADKGGSPGSIYRVDGVTGDISLFSTIGANSGPGLGDVVFDAASRQFFASDLDTGLIYRLDSTGLIEDTFDHGVDGRPAHGLAPVADDGSRMDISSPAFSSEDPGTWGLTPPERRVGGMAVHGGRLYYAVAAGPQVWSVGIGLDGSFRNDPRWELDVTAPASSNAVTDIVFDSAGRMILAQRGAQRGSFDDSVFADPKSSAVLRYSREVPDDPATPGVWVPVPEEYAVGFRPELRNTNGGVALGYGYDAKGVMQGGSCGAFLWTTGESLRDDPALAAQLSAGGPATVDGLQGNDVSLVRPANVPPFSSYFTDYDGNFDHPEHQGWMGDVEVFQPCAGASLGYPGYQPPSFWFPPGLPPSGSFNLTLDKEATPRVCRPAGMGWLCRYTIRVTNTGSVPYWGPLSIRDWMPAAPAGAIVNFDFQPPWMCGVLGPFAYECSLPGVYLLPGDGVDLFVTVHQPGGQAPGNLCYAGNGAAIDWWDGYGDANPADDVDYAEARIPRDDCRQHGGGTNLRIRKQAVVDRCVLTAGGWRCPFQVTVTNTGPGVYSGPITVSEEPSAPVPMDYGPQPNPPFWTCTPAGGGNYSCTHAPVTLNPGESIALFVTLRFTENEQAASQRCDIANRARIIAAPGGSPGNLDPGDDTAAASIMVPARNCEPPVGKKSDLSLTKRKTGCNSLATVPALGCGYVVTVKNEGPDAFAGPLTVHDQTTPGTGAVPWAPAPWNCAAAGAGYDCSADLSATPLAPGASINLPLVFNVPLDSNVCTLSNTAKISVPPGGSPANANPGNDASGAVVIDLPLTQCNPSGPEANLSILKRPQGCDVGQQGTTAAVAVSPGVTCRYEIVVKNNGPDNVSGLVSFRDLPDIAGTTVITPSAAGWNCAAAGLYTDCSTGSGLTAGASAAFTAEVKTSAADVREQQCEVKNRAWITTPVGAPMNTLAPDDTSLAVAAAPAGLCSQQKILNLETCPVDRQMPDQGCCPAGQRWNGRACSGGQISTPPTVIIKSCPQGMVGTYPDCRPRKSGACPADSVGKWPNCQCRKGSYGDPGNCRRGRPRCPADTVGKWPNCQPIVQRCPKGTAGNWPNCERIVQRCPQGTVGRWPNCERIVQRCPKGTVGKWPNCERIVQRCPKGTVGNWPNCERIVQRCPDGTVGKWPNCQRPSTGCPEGFRYSRKRGCVPLQQDVPEQQPQHTPKLRINPQIMQPQFQQEAPQ